MDALYDKHNILTSNLQSLGRVAVAFSSGVDSAFLLKVAHDTLGANAIAITADFNSFPGWELRESKAFTRRYGIEHIVFDFDDLAVDGFADNPPDRCYLCKRSIMQGIKDIAQAHNIEHVLDGSNVDDDSDFRPGMRALRELNILSPLKTAGLTKADIRALSKALELTTWDKASCACLASRFAVGERITREKLRMVEAAEDFLRARGLSQVRVRVHGELARVEVAPDEFGALLRAELLHVIHHELIALGFRYATLDLGGYRTGSMNDA